MKRQILNSSKRTITTAIASVTMAAFMVGGPALADPDNPKTDTTETQIITETEVTREGVIEVAPTDEANTAENTIDLLAPSEDTPSEDRIIIREKTEVMTDTTEVSDESEAVITEDSAPLEEDAPLVIEDNTEITIETETPEAELTEASVETANYACHIQPNGETECICKDDASCEALTNSDDCQPYTEWRDSELGGCTKKAG